MLVLSLALGFAGLYLVAGEDLFRGETYRVRDWNPLYPAVLVGAVFAEWTTPALRVRLLCREQGIPMRYRPALYAHLVAVLGAAVTPSNTGGAPATVAALGRLGVPVGKGIGVIVQIFVLDLIFFVWSAPLGLGFLVYSDTVALPVNAETTTLAMIFAAVAGAVLLTRYPRLVVRAILAIAGWPLARRFKPRLRGIARDYHKSAAVFRRMSVPSRLALHLITTVGWLAAFTILWAMLRLYGTQTGLLTVLALLASLTLISHLFPTPGGSGFIEAAVALGAGATPGGGVAAAVLMWRLASFYLIFLLGPLAGWLLYRSPPVARPPKASARARPREPEKHL